MLSAADASTSQTSEPTNIEQLDKASIRVSWTGSPIGTFQVEVRTGAKKPWFALDMGSVIDINSTTYPDLNHVIQLFELPFTDIRVVYTSTSGTGTISADLHMKTVGA